LPQQDSKPPLFPTACLSKTANPLPLFPTACLSKTANPLSSRQLASARQQTPSLPDSLPQQDSAARFYRGCGFSAAGAGCRRGCAFILCKSSFKRFRVRGAGAFFGRLARPIHRNPRTPPYLPPVVRVRPACARVRPRAPASVRGWGGPCAARSGARRLGTTPGHARRVHEMRPTTLRGGEGWSKS
jgi:hypothetical protein